MGFRTIPSPSSMPVLQSKPYIEKRIEVDRPANPLMLESADIFRCLFFYLLRLYIFRTRIASTYIPMAHAVLHILPNMKRRRVGLEDILSPGFCITHTHPHRSQPYPGPRRIGSCGVAGIAMTIGAEFTLLHFIIIIVFIPCSRLCLGHDLRLWAYPVTLSYFYSPPILLLAQ